MSTQKDRLLLGIITVFGFLWLGLSVQANAAAIVGSSPSVSSKDPDCTSVEGWATSMAFVFLKNAGITDNYKVDFTKTKTIRLASEKIGQDLYRQIHKVTFTEKSGNIIEVITMNDASHQECSMSGVDVFVVSKHLGPH